jgi:hypothetical protein
LQKDIRIVPEQAAAFNEANLSHRWISGEMMTASKGGNKPVASDGPGRPESEWGRSKIESKEE